MTGEEGQKNIGSVNNERQLLFLVSSLVCAIRAAVLIEFISAGVVKVLMIVEVTWGFKCSRAIFKSELIVSDGNKKDKSY